MFRRIFNSPVARESKVRHLVKFCQQYADMLNMDGNPYTYLLPYRKEATIYAAEQGYRRMSLSDGIVNRLNEKGEDGTSEASDVIAVPQRRLSLSAKASDYMVWVTLHDDQGRPYYYNQSKPLIFFVPPFVILL